MIATVAGPDAPDDPRAGRTPEALMTPGHIQAAHARLSAAARGERLAAGSPRRAEIIAFVKAAAAAGALIPDDPAEGRRRAQRVIDFWVAGLNSAPPDEAGRPPEPEFHRLAGFRPAAAEERAEAAEAFRRALPAREAALAVAMLTIFLDPDADGRRLRPHPVPLGEWRDRALALPGATPAKVEALARGLHVAGAVSLWREGDGVGEEIAELSTEALLQVWPALSAAAAEKQRVRDGFAGDRLARSAAQGAQPGSRPVVALDREETEFLRLKANRRRWLTASVALAVALAAVSGYALWLAGKRWALDLENEALKAALEDVRTANEQLAERRSTDMALIEKVAEAIELRDPARLTQALRALNEETRDEARARIELALPEGLIAFASPDDAPGASPPDEAAPAEPGWPSAGPEEASTPSWPEGTGPQGQDVDPPSGAIASITRPGVDPPPASPGEEAPPSPVRPPDGDPDAGAAGEAFVCRGLLQLDTRASLFRPAQPPAGAWRAGDRIETAARIRLREDLGAGAGDPIGAIEAGVALDVTGPAAELPVAGKQGPPGLFLPVAAPGPACVTVYLQFAGSRSAADRLGDSLAGAGFQTPGAEQLDAARTLFQLRYFHAVDRDSGRVDALARAAEAALAELGTPRRIETRDMTDWPRTKPPVGVIELWLDLGDPDAPG